MKKLYNIRVDNLFLLEIYKFLWDTILIYSCINLFKKVLLTLKIQRSQTGYLLPISESESAIRNSGSGSERIFTVHNTASNRGSKLKVRILKEVNVHAVKTLKKPIS
jgi:hypothetical protein